jgi:hypothetical protein
MDVFRHGAANQNLRSKAGTASMKLLAKRIGILTIWLVSLVVIVAAGFLAAMSHHFHPAAPQPHFPPAAGALDAQRQDIRYFRQLLTLDRSYTQTDRAEANRRLDLLEALSTVLDRGHFRVAVMQIDALADNGHSRVETDPSAEPLELPVRVAVFSDGLYIMRATENNADLLGARVVAIDGQPIEAAMTKLGQLRGGTLAWRRLHASQYLPQQDLLFGADVALDMQHSDWTVETPVGASVTRRLDAAPAREPAAFVTRWLSSERMSGMAAPWRAFEADHPLPVSWTDFDDAFRSLRLPGTCIQFIQLKTNSDEGSRSITKFLAGLESHLRQVQPCNVIFDLRFDGGGDYVNTYHFARVLPELIPPAGRIFVLTGPATFSAGITTTAVVKHAGQGRVVILGEPVGDRLQFFSEGGRACLPNTPLCVAYETGKHDYQHACKDWDVCFWLNYLFQFRVNSLDPDEVIQLRFKDWRAGVDPVLNRAIFLAAPSARGNP